jgi:hypothetical protein
VGLVMCGTSAYCDPPEIEAHAFAMILSVPDDRIRTWDVDNDDAEFRAKVPRKADEETVARRLAELAKSRGDKWCDGVATPELVAERLMASDRDKDHIYDGLAAALVLAGRHDEAVEPLEFMIDCPDADPQFRKYRLELRKALRKDPRSAKALLVQRAKETAKRIGVAKWFKPG